MRNPVAKFRSSKLSQVAFVALASAGVAGCSTDVARFGDPAPTYTGSTPNQRQILGGAPQSAPVYAPDVTGSIGAQPAPVQRPPKSPVGASAPEMTTIAGFTALMAR